MNLVIIVTEVDNKEFRDDRMGTCERQYTHVITYNTYTSRYDQSA